MITNIKSLILNPLPILSIFFAITFLILFEGKSYTPPSNEANSYNGEKILSTKNDHLVLAKGTVNYVRLSSQGITFLKIKGTQGDFATSFFPSLGKLPFTPRIGDSVSILGLVSNDKGSIQINPLSNQSISKINNSEVNMPQVLFPSISIIDLDKYIDQIVWIEKVKVDYVNKFNSQKGQKMLKFKITDLNNNW